MKQLPYIILTAVLLTSCIKPVDTIELEGFEPKIVLNGLLTPGEIVEISVTKNIGLLDKEEVEPLENASIELWGENGFIDNLIYTERGIYVSSIPLPTDQNQFTIIATHDGYERTHASIDIPSPGRIVSIDTSFKIITYEEMYYDYDTSIALYWTEGRIEFDIVISDPGDVQNYYILYLRKKEKDYYYDYNNSDHAYFYPIIDSAYFLRIITFDSDEHIFEISVSYFDASSIAYSEGEYYQSGVGFSDVLINGKMTTLNLSVNMSELYGYYNFVTTMVYIQLLSVNKDYYQYLKSLSMYSDDPFDNFFTERVSLYTNVENGLGLVGGCSLSVDSIDLLNSFYEAMQQW